MRSARQLFKHGVRADKFIRSGRNGIQSSPVCGSYGRDIVECLCPAFDFEAGNSGRGDQIKERRCAEIVRVQDIASVFIFRNVKAARHAGMAFSSRACFYAPRPSAGLRAFTAVGVAPGEIMRQQAAPGKRHAHCAVDKRFQLEFLRRLRPDFRNVA